MVISWHWNGVASTIFPKLPLYLKKYHDKWERNKQIENSILEVRKGADKLKPLNMCLAFTSTFENDIDSQDDTMPSDTDKEYATFSE